jgi:hypothetical protein
MTATKGTFEARVVSDLNNRSIAFEYEPEKLPYTVQRNYIPDLRIGEMYVEVKGYFRQEAQRKMRNVREQHPEKDIRFLFQRLDSPVQGAKKRKDGSKMTCAEWAERHGFLYAEKEIPDEWIN